MLLLGGAITVSGSPDQITDTVWVYRIDRKEYAVVSKLPGVNAGMVFVKAGNRIIGIAASRRKNQLFRRRLDSFVLTLFKGLGAGQGRSLGASVRVNPGDAGTFDWRRIFSAPMASRTAV